jgi:nicotinate-nucleotide adenylyltransferase
MFGGAFDPPHAAHAALIKAALQELSLDRLLVIPTGQAWHKQRDLSPAADRLAMAQLAFGQIPGVSIDPRETQRSGPSYTVDSLRELHAQWQGAELYLIMGQDQAKALPSWHAWQEVVELAIICVAGRDDLTGNRKPYLPPSLLESRFRRLSVPLMDLSATDIRARIARRQSPVPLVFEPVARYIAEHHLYQTA